MGQKRCTKCEEMVDEAKAFCPGCGNAFVEEEHREATSFEKMDSTIQLGQTMYNRMLSDMGLNASRDNPSQEKRIEIIQPIAETAKPAGRSEERPPQKGLSNTTKWMIAAGIVLVLGLMVVLAAAVLLYIFWPRLT